MNRVEFQTFLRAPYNREQWLTHLHLLLPGTQIFAASAQLTYLDDKARQAVISAEQIARTDLADGRKVAIIEVRVSGQVDLQRNRVGLRHLVARFIDQERADAVLGFFRGDSIDYRLSCVARTSEIGEDGQLATQETAPRRYTYLLGPGQACRTPAERLDGLRSRRDGIKLKDLITAFKVEPLFKEFYQEYREVFAKVENLARASLPEAEKLRLFTQRLFNRVMFLAFIERRGWLRFGQRQDFLAALWDDYVRARLSESSSRNFYRDRLVPLFFEGLNQSDRTEGFSDPRFGCVPYLNGGLFERADDTDSTAIPIVPDEALAAILDAETGLFSRYNFTVAESTPLEIDVAVDPEMLGKVFEELVTGRHEQGSYYTPKPIVSFMGRAALVEYLAYKCERESHKALEAFVHEHEPGQLKNAEAVLAALRSVTVCDPACGSGAYLLGMLHELLDLRICLFAANQKLDSTTAHDRKLEIIETNLYGVDIDPFAVNIARLRLWLSLAVDFEGKTPPPLPNLDFKIEQGDSLSARAPAEVIRDNSDLYAKDVREFRAKKAAYLRAHGKQKEALHQQITDLKSSLKSWLSTEGPANAFHWAIEFAEVFLPTTTPNGTIAGELALVNDTRSQQELLDSHSASRNHQADGGFDIVVANPPYVRMELIKPLKPTLRRRFPHVHAERADLYIYFYARAHELLRPGGVAAFISSNKWLRAGYGEALRQHLLDMQAFRLVMDFGELPVFESAATDAAIFLWQKLPRKDAGTAWAMVKNLPHCYAQGVRSHFVNLRVDVPHGQFGKGKPRLATITAADLRGQMERSGSRLGEFCKGLLGWGIKTGLNEAFVIDQETRDRLVAETSSAVEIIRPLLAGDDVRRYEVTYRGTYLIYAFRGVDIARYRSIENHLRPYRSFKNEKGKIVGLDHRATNQEWFELQQPQMAYEEFFNSAKIVYPDFGKELRFAMDLESRFSLNTAYFIACEDWYLLAVLNSSSVFQYLKGTCQLLGDEDDGGRLRFFGQYLETLPIPDASDSDRKVVGELSRRAQSLHSQRRTRVEQFLKNVGVDPMQSTSRNPLEQPWILTTDDFAKRTKKLTGRFGDLDLYKVTRDETIALTEQIAKIEAEIDVRVAALYGLSVPDAVSISSIGAITEFELNLPSIPRVTYAGLTYFESVLPLLLGMIPEGLETARLFHAMSLLTDSHLRTKEAHLNLGALGRQWADAFIEPYQWEDAAAALVTEVAKHRIRGVTRFVLAPEAAVVESDPWLAVDASVALRLALAAEPIAVAQSEAAHPDTKIEVFKLLQAA